MERAHLLPINVGDRHLYQWIS